MVVTSPVPASVSEPGVAAALALFATGARLSRAEVAGRTGWARVTVTARLERLLEDGLLESFESRVNGRGRPATHYRLAVDAGSLLVADIGASGLRVARCDLAGRPGPSQHLPSEIGDGPDAVLGVVRAGWEDLMEGAPPVWGVAVSLPGPVELSTGRVVDPPIMTGWNDYGVRDELATWFGTTAHVENDANAIALGEVAAVTEAGGSLSDVLVVKVGTGVGAGIISGGQVLRGAAGAAGDIGHTEADVAGVRSDRPLCRCGKLGCVEAYAGGWALVRDARERGLEVEGLDDFLECLVAGDPVARALTAEAGQVLGSAVATTVSLLNPEQVLLAGALGLVGEHLVAGVRQRVYARSLPLATRTLRIQGGRLGVEAGVRGLAHELSRRVLLGAAAG
ncbi:Sugar kinase of the NBD/HSP70 family, may contain an N-terminal HTH domain [Nocardioides scoriae]|uniref:Sugar kinase of the NBD/HSP70 family, may contain an N-terminal HTH domain n=1 Tax=Nocardioides scoriae TaxID=642780 RepID=A0A1H1Y8P5_9ACTN|nr:ROK family transcriptional regulator [Nocardioides scoriae]SDT17782.1 Sugar kinase of the NBD/HSP70 family, may contain an N-terminal HTH domain [Nocardioides scoriae]